MSDTKTIVFIGASGGCGLAALRKALQHSDSTICIALCRNPSKLTDVFPPSSHPNLVVKQGNAHSVEDIKSVLINPSDPTQLVDALCFTIGSPMNFSKLSTEDPHVCERGISTVLRALSDLRSTGAVGKPHICAVSTTDITAKRDVPLLMLPFYHYVLGVPHKDKAAMEEGLRVAVGEGEEVTIVRPSLLTDGEETGAEVRVGVDDVRTGERESEAVGYTIGRADVGKWMWENVLREGGYGGKSVSITY
ncbi:hypothetical protein B0T11DRAFT_279066 [Plectosphaerella cucumerina]|uniref:NAD(P)-binding domain-containing protein n=1 Tax=Plectosphaerella cucumerina TaxID=40658 RepID=A0A8K0X489_9PEZI|nr:hypothetical protein B0T11DRAFT_279066 [Plectosphaerella cucumerina]